MQYVVVGHPSRNVYINCIKVGKSGIFFSYTDDNMCEIFEMVRLANWLFEQRRVNTPEDAIRMLLVEAGTLANMDRLWIDLND